MTETRSRSRGPHDVTQQKAIIREAFVGMGWETPRVLAAMADVDWLSRRADRSWPRAIAVKDYPRLIATPTGADVSAAHRAVS